MSDMPVGLPERYHEPWTELANEAARKRLRVEVRIKTGTTPEVGPDGLLRGSFLVFGQERSEAPEDRLGTAETFDQALTILGAWLAGHPLPGPDALREELRAFGRRLAVLQPRDVARKRGADLPIYRDFRDRILPLAWDNLVDSVRMEALEDFVRRVGAMDVHGLKEVSGEHFEGALASVFDVAAEARGLVAPKEAEDGSLAE